MLTAGKNIGLSNNDYGNTLAPKAPDSQINNELINLQEAVAQQRNLIEALDNRLNPVLNRVGGGEQKENHPEPVLCPLAQSMKDLKRLVSINNTLLNNLLSSIEL